MKEILYDWGGANIWPFHAINDVRNEFLDKFMLLGTQLGEHSLFPFYLALISLFALHQAAMDRQKTQRWLIVIAVFSTAYLLDGMLIGFLKPLLDFPRPPLALPQGTVHIVGKAEYHHSLPSGHSSFAMLCTASLWPELNRHGRIAGVFFVLWVGISRISLGAHFPADVLAGFLSSLAVVLMVRATIKAYARKSN